MFRTLDIHPAFGFESVDRWKVACHQRDEFIRKEKLQLLGYHRLWGDSRAALNNFSKLLLVFQELTLLLEYQELFYVQKKIPNFL
ncbi:MAG: hypothetical protein HWD61_10170 [Parachlamydiaceae bacterium]|nr:MAG: hypothetical protein HWD61_10170 [Parachlamydiaceae bacterium]